jgi:hypothetical protein
MQRAARSDIPEITPRISHRTRAELSCLTLGAVAAADVAGGRLVDVHVSVPAGLRGGTGIGVGAACRLDAPDRGDVRSHTEDHGSSRKAKRHNARPLVPSTSTTPTGKLADSGSWFGAHMTRMGAAV